MELPGKSSMEPDDERAEPARYEQMLWCTVVCHLWLYSSVRFENVLRHHAPTFMKLKFPAIILLFIITNSLLLRAQEVQVSDIGGGVTLIGRLGKPMGTVVTNIQGQLISEPKQGKSGLVTAALRVSKVDGKALPKAQVVGVVFRLSEGMPSVHANDIVKFSGYESGSFIGTPDAAREALGKDASPLDWKFESTVHVIKLL